MMRAMVLIAVTMVLTACVSREELLQRDGLTCADIGFAPGSEQNANCLLQLQSSRLRGHHAGY